MIPGIEERNKPTFAVPRTRGDDPFLFIRIVVFDILFPAHAGMIPRLAGPILED